ncbi:MAG: hypothetical protein BGP16_00890 [Sphingobium sp. 66-54]|nr:MAG: hypothetical protein BGP16_00890 [Sphingobium sp. 66-54]
MNLLDLTNHITQLVNSDAGLRDGLHAKWLYVGIPETYPCITISEISFADDKEEGEYSFNLSLWYQNTTGAAGELKFYELAGKLKALVSNSNLIAGGSWVSRNQPDGKTKRALFACSTYL